MGSVTSLVQGRRGRVLEIDQDERGDHVAITADVPVEQMFGFTSSLRSATAGMAYWSLKDSRFEPMPKEIQSQAILDTRKRKGMKEEVPDTAYLR